MMERKQFSKSPCSIARSLDILGDWWTPLILRECHYGICRFSDFITNLGIGRNILTRRLKMLTTAGLLDRQQYQVSPPRFDYHLTQQGYDALVPLFAMMVYGESWHFKKTPIQLYDKRTDEPVQPLVIDANTGLALEPGQIYAGPGPAFPKNKRLKYHRFAEYYRRREKI